MNERKYRVTKHGERVAFIGATVPEDVIEEMEYAAKTLKVGIGYLVTQALVEKFRKKKPKQ